MEVLTHTLWWQMQYLKDLQLSEIIQWDFLFSGRKDKRNKSVDAPSASLASNGALRHDVNKLLLNQCCVSGDVEESGFTEFSIQANSS